MKHFQPYFSLLIFSTLLCVIAASSAIHILAGQGHDVLLFGLGVGVGMTWSCYVGLENWRITPDALERISEQVNVLSLVLSRSQLHYLHPQIAMRLATASLTTSSEFQLELEVRALLDAVALLGQAVIAGEVCHCCQATSHQHNASCTYVRAMQLHEAGCQKRVGWTQFNEQVKPSG
jgi:hypothetical protein